jgi:hypothetical protein
MSEQAKVTHGNATRLLAVSFVDTRFVHFRILSVISRGQEDPNATNQ